MSAVYWMVFRAATTIAGLSAVVKGVSVAKESLVAYRVGTAPELDAFLVAYAFPSFLLNVLTGAVAAGFVPAYVRLRSAEGDESASRFATSVSWLLAGALLVCALLAAPTFGGLIRLTAVGFDDQTINTAVTMLYALMPVLFLNGLTGFWSGFLNAHGRFAVAALVPLATPAAIIVALVSLWSVVGVYALVIGTLAGSVVEAVCLAYAAKRRGLNFLPILTHDWRKVRGVLAQAVPAAGSNILIGSTLLVDQAMAAMLVPGSVAALSYGTRVTGVVVAIGTMALATALLPHLSSLVARGHFMELRALIRQYAILTLVLTVPLTALLVGTSEAIVTLLFERGSFGPTDSALVADVQIAYALQIPFFSLAMIAVRLITAMQANTFLLVSSAISLVLNVVLNWVLSRHYGVVGLALSTSLVYAVACVFLWSVAVWKLNKIADNAEG